MRAKFDSCFFGIDTRKQVKAQYYPKTHSGKTENKDKGWGEGKVDNEGKGEVGGEDGDGDEGKGGGGGMRVRKTEA